MASIIEFVCVCVHAQSAVQRLTFFHRMRAHATIALQERPELQRLRESAKTAGVQLAVLGLNRPYPANGQKVVLYLEHLRTLPPDQIVVGIDAYDVLLSPDIHR
jgi:hypothetical protein